MEIDKVPDDSRKRGVQPASLKNLTGGSRKGVPNKATKALKEMILGALEGVGGEQYLMDQATENPTAFLTLVGKVLPSEIKAEVSVAVPEALAAWLDQRS